MSDTPHLSGFSSDEQEKLLQHVNTFVDDVGSMKLEPLQLVAAIGLAVATAAHRTGKPLTFYELMDRHLAGQIEDEQSHQAKHK